VYVEVRCTRRRVWVATRRCARRFEGGRRRGRVSRRGRESRRVPLGGGVRGDAAPVAEAPAGHLALLLSAPVSESTDTSTTAMAPTTPHEGRSRARLPRSFPAARVFGLPRRSLQRGSTAGRTSVFSPRGSRGAASSCSNVAENGSSWLIGLSVMLLLHVSTPKLTTDFPSPASWAFCEVAVSFRLLAGYS